MKAQLFNTKKIASQQKLRGGYYTPTLMTQYLAKWLLAKKVTTILEPSFGDGNFIESILDHLQEQQIEVTGVEINQEEFYKGINRVRGKYEDQVTFNWFNNDFFKAYELLKNKSFDAVIGNPPFIRFQHFNAESRDIAFQHLRANGYKPTKLANVWAAFVQLSIALLKEGGHLAMVLPAELLQVKYAKELRDRILSSFDKVTLITFKKLVFPDILQEVIILLAEGKRNSPQLFATLKVIPLHDGTDLMHLDPEKYENTLAPDTVKHGLKWTSLFVAPKNLASISQVYYQSDIPKFGDFADVNVGIVTGRNKFFVLDKETVDQYSLHSFVVPLVGKTSAIHQACFKQQDFDLFQEKHPAFLLNLKTIPEEKFTKGLQEYIALGEQEEVHKGYKCRIRKRWYDVPSVYISDGFLYRQVYKYPLLVTNAVKASCTDTIHRVRLTQDVEMGALSAAFINSFTFAWSELCGRSYGGGVLELEPNEAEELPLPIHDKVNLDQNFVDQLVRNGEIEKALDYVDEQLLIKAFGLSKIQTQQFRAIWKTLSNRRLNRG